jgi:hypothetical protein
MDNTWGWVYNNFLQYNATKFLFKIVMVGLEKRCLPVPYIIINFSDGEIDIL